MSRQIKPSPSCSSSTNRISPDSAGSRHQQLNDRGCSLREDERPTDHELPEQLTDSFARGRRVGRLSRSRVRAGARWLMTCTWIGVSSPTSSGHTRSSRLTELWCRAPARAVLVVRQVDLRCADASTFPVESTVGYSSMLPSRHTPHRRPPLPWHAVQVL